MKKLLASFLLIVIPYCLFPQEKELSEEQLKFYNRNKLSIEIKKSGLGYASLNTGLISYSEWRKWQAYQGFIKIPEEKFFNITGYEYEANKAQEYRKTTNLLLYSGGAVYLVGMGLIISSLAVEYDDPNYDQKVDTRLYGGLAIGLVGAIPFGVGIDRSYKNWAPASKAKEIAEEYNEELIKKIKE